MIDLNFNPKWYWIGNAGLGVWDGVWRKDRRSEVFGRIGEFNTSPDSPADDSSIKPHK
jgi:hypothetical protein